MIFKTSENLRVPLPIDGPHPMSRLGSGRRVSICFFASVCLLLGLCIVANANGQEVDAERAMRSLGSNSYYDKSEDQFASPRVQIPEDNPIRVEGWSTETQPEGSWLRFWDNLWDGFGPFNGWGGGRLGGISGDFFSGFIITILVIVLLAVVGTLIYFSFRDYMPTPRRSSKSVRSAIRIDPMKAEDLPIEVSHKISNDPLGEVRALIEAGRYRDATIVLYAYELLALDTVRLIELEKGKTNRGYLKELSGQTGLKEILASTIELFEDAFFGDIDIEPSRFMKEWERVPRFHELLPAEGSSSAKSAAVVVPSREALA